MKFKYKNILITAVIITALLGIFQLANTFEDKKSINYEVFNVGNGFGYKITHNKKVIIQQENIPTIEGVSPFTNRKDAKKTAMLVIKKLKNGDSPRITISDLEKLHISNPSTKQKME